MKRIAALTLMLMMCVSVALADTGILNTESALPIVTEPLTLTIAARQHPTHMDYDQMYMYDKYEEMTGVTIEWELTPDATWNERKSLLMTSDELPDIFLRANFTLAEQLNYGAMQGLLLDLNPLLEEYAPNFYALLEKYPDVRASITLDGGIYGLPQVIEPLGPRDNGFWINTKWLDKCGLEMPTTIDEFYQMLVAFRDCDFNGNGQADEFAASFRSSTTSINNMMNTFMGIYNLRTLGVASGWTYLDEEGSLSPIVTQARYRELLRFLNKLWEEKLIDLDAFTHSNAQLTAKGQDGIYGVLMGVNSPGLASGNLDDIEFWKGMPAIENPWGETVWGSIGSMLNNQGTAAISASCEHPEVALRWLDYFYSVEGEEFLYWGIEGDTFEWQDGVRVWTDKVTESPNKFNDFLPRDSSQLPLVQIKDIVADMTSWNATNQYAAGDMHMPYDPKTIWTPVFTAAEQSELTTLQTDIDTYVREMRLKFIMGDIDIDNDDQWNNYLNRLNTMGLQRYMEIYTASYERAYGVK